MENNGYRSYWSVLPGEIVHDKSLPIPAKYLYVILSSMAHKNGFCWPSNESIASEIGLSKRRAVELLAMLRDAGYIRILFKPHGNSERRYIYCGMFPDRTDLEPDEDAAGDGGEWCEESQGGGADNRTPPCENSHPPHAKNTFAIRGRTLKEEKQKEEQQRESWFQNIQLQLKNPDFRNWISEVLQNRKESYLFLLQQYKENKKELEDLLQKTDRAAETLAASEKRELLAVFAAKVTGNPHYFDEGETAEKCLSSYLKWKLKKERSNGLSNAEYKNRIYFEAGILKDELSNDVLTYGLHAWKENGEPHSGIEGFFRCKEPLKLTLKTLGGLGKITGEQKIYMVENPAVFSRLVEKYPDRTILCGNGQPKFSVFVLLDKLTENSTIYYAGDFDPEGLQIAQNLKKRYPEHFIFWKYKAEYYQKYKSEVQLDEKRIRKLDKIDLPELQEIKEAMQREKYAAYQEAMVEEYE